MKKWFGLWKQDLYRCFVNKRYLLIVILIPIIMIGCIYESVLAQIKYNMFDPTSGPAKLMELLYFDRFKAIIIVLLSAIYTHGIAEDLQNSFWQAILSREISISQYVIAKLLANAAGILLATMGCFLTFLILISPVFPLEGRDGFSVTTSNFYAVVQMGKLPWLYAILTGFQFGLAAIFLSNISMMISIWIPSRYVTIAIPYVLFYILYAFTLILPHKLDFWWLSSCWGVLDTNAFWPNFLYSNGILMVGDILVGAGCVLVMKKNRVRCFEIHRKEF